jgi:hypothetical protein
MAAALMIASDSVDRAWRESTAENVDDDLAVLWSDIGREAPISRAVMANLLVVSRPPAGAGVDMSLPAPGPVEDVARRHPARIILLRHDPKASDPSTADAEVAARVGVLTFGPPDARYGIEQIVVGSSCSEPALPSIVRALMLGDVPISVWWIDDMSAARPLTSLATMGRQLLFDSRQWGDVRKGFMALAPLLADPFAPDLADVNWRRLLPLRQALIHAMESCDEAHRRTLMRARLRYRSGEEALAWLFAGWIENAGSRGRGHDSKGEAGDLDPSIVIEEGALPADDLLSVSFSDGLSLRLGARSVTVIDPIGSAPFAMPVPLESEADAVAAELRMLRRDESLRAALTTLIQRFGTA